MTCDLIYGYIRCDIIVDSKKTFFTLILQIGILISISKTLCEPFFGQLNICRSRRTRDNVLLLITAENRKTIPPYLVQSSLASERKLVVNHILKTKT